MTPEAREKLQRAGSTALACLLVALAAFSAGRFSAPLEVEERVRFIETERSQRSRSEEKDRRQQKVVYVDRVITKEGEVREKIVEKLVMVDASKVDEKASTERQAEALNEKKTTLQPDWRIAAQVGASLKEPALPIAGPLVIGVQAERRIAGGFSGGLWVNTSGAAGVVLSVEF